VNLNAKSGFEGDLFQKAPLTVQPYRTYHAITKNSASTRFYDFILDQSEELLLSCRPPKLDKSDDILRN